MSNELPPSEDGREQTEKAGTPLQYYTVSVFLGVVFASAAVLLSFAPPMLAVALGPIAMEASARAFCIVFVMYKRGAPARLPTASPETVVFTSGAASLWCILTGHPQGLITLTGLFILSHAYYTMRFRHVVEPGRRIEYTQIMAVSSLGPILIAGVLWFIWRM